MRSSLLPALLIAVHALAIAAPAHAEPMRTIVRLAPAPGEDGDELWARMRGQTSDLDVVLIRVDDDGEPALTHQLQAASRLAVAHDVRAVVWLRPLPAQPGVAVYVAEPDADRVFVRHVPQREPGLAARSATAEAAALVVRSALRALAAGTPIGVPARSLVAEQAPAPSASPTGLRWHLAAHWQAAADGAQRLGHHGAALRVGLGRGAWQVHAAVATHPAATLVDDRARLRVARHGAGLGLVWLRDAAALRLGAALDVSALLYTRTTAPAVPGVVAAAPAYLPALAISPGVHVRVPLGARALVLELAVAADVLVGAPEFVYQRAGATELHTRLWPVQPRASLGLLWLL
jgi:hypothetical protein